MYLIIIFCIFDVCLYRETLHLHMTIFCTKKNTFKNGVIYVKVKSYRSVLQAVNTYQK